MEIDKEAEERHRSDWIKAEYETMGWIEEEIMNEAKKLAEIEKRLDDYNAKCGTSANLCLFCHAKEYNGKTGIIHSPDCIIISLRSVIAGYLPGETSRTPATDLENDLSDKEFARQYSDARIKSSWEIKMVEELGYSGSYIPVQLEVLEDEEIQKMFDLAYHQNQSYNAGISEVNCEPEDMM